MCAWSNENVLIFNILGFCPTATDMAMVDAGLWGNPGARCELVSRLTTTSVVRYVGRVERVGPRKSLVSGPSSP